ncbi:unnamed protein product [Heterobilharzia americana]|nr:unnamed protein product [Heterobilharzia americana]
MSAMADSASELDLESDASSVDGTKDLLVTNEQVLRRIESLQQENRVLKTEVETLKLKIKGLNDLNQQLRRNSVSIFTQLRQEKDALERTLAREQENQVSKLMRRIEKLEADMNQKQDCLDQLRREKIELENALEQEQEALVNRLWKKMEKLEAEKKMLREKLESVGAPLPIQLSSQNLDNNPEGTSVPFTNSTIPRPLSSGPGSLRSSFRQHGRPLNASSSGSVAASLGVITSLVSTSQIAVSSAGEEKTVSNQNTCIQNDVVGQKPGASECNGASFPLLPQSPMDIDALDPNASGAPSPCGSVGVISPQATVINPPSLKIPPTFSNARKVFMPQELSMFGQTSDELQCPSTHVITLSYVNRLRDEVCRLRQLLQRYEAESARKMPQYESEEKSVAEENRRLRKLLQIEKERREALSKHLSESESSLEMEDERHFNEASRTSRLRTISDCSSPFPTPVSATWTSSGNASSSLYGPGHAFAVAVAASVAGHSGSRVCRECGQPLISSCSADASGGRSLSNSTHNPTYASNIRGCSVRCCSPVGNLNTSEVRTSNSPSTPTTSSLNSDHTTKCECLNSFALYPCLLDIHPS